MNPRIELQELRKKIPLTEDEEKRQQYLDRIFEIMEKTRRTSLHIDRIPEKTKTRFLEVAQNEFEKDYGMLLKYILEQSEEYQKVKKYLFKQIGIEDAKSL